MRDVRGGGRRVHGSIAGNGNTVSGVGFLVTKLGTGNYRIDFLEPFSAPPHVNVTLYAPAGTPRVGRSNNTATEKSIFVNTYNPTSSTDADEPFFFEATEPVR